MEKYDFINTMYTDQWSMIKCNESPSQYAPRMNTQELNIHLPCIMQWNIV
jgi:hypothetical protein